MATNVDKQKTNMLTSADKQKTNTATSVDKQKTNTVTSADKQKTNTATSVDKQKTNTVTSADKQKTNTATSADSHKAHHCLQHMHTAQEFCAYFWWANRENMSRIFCWLLSTLGVAFFFPRDRPDTRHFFVPTPEKKIELHSQWFT